MSVPNRFAVGLGLIDAIAGLDAKSVKLQSRVGIATGLVVVGELIGEGSAREQSIVGENAQPRCLITIVSSAMCDEIRPEIQIRSTRRRGKWIRAAVGRKGFRSRFTFLV
jgi:hypothetical protein